ncbi:MAG: mRNA interferase RelE/StbE [Desulforhopalus sp.]|jgi:mRNA interferase RelE/StbE
MIYDLRFKEDAKKEWDKLDKHIQEILKKKLKERLVDPKVVSAKLRGMNDCYKIKLRGSGHRLVYQIRDNELVIVVIAVGKRDKNLVYKIATKRM